MPRPLPLAALLAAGLALSAPACSRLEERQPGGGAQDARDWASLRNFDAIDLTGPDDVKVTIGDRFSVKAQGDARLIHRLDIHLEGRTLSIGRRNDGGSFWGDGGSATIFVTLPAISAIAVTGSGNFTLDKAVGPALKLSLTGSGNATVDSVAVADLGADLTGSGDVNLAGGARAARFSVTGSGDIDAHGLKVARGEVKLLGSGNVGFASDGPVAITITGSGDVTVKGKAQCTSNGTGSGEAHCG